MTNRFFIHPQCGRTLLTANVWRVKSRLRVLKNGYESGFIDGKKSYFLAGACARAAHSFAACLSA